MQDWRSMRPRWSSADRAAFFDARIAAVHAGLTLTPDQEKLWPPVEAAVRDGARAWREARERFATTPPPSDPIERLRRAADRATMRGENLRKIADAAAPLYATLSSEQKDRLAVLTHMGRWRMAQRSGPDGGMEPRWRGGRPDDRDDWQDRRRGGSFRHDDDEDDSGRL